MKIGIVTQPLIGNFGGILQNLALQKVLRDEGHDPITLDFRNGDSKLRYFFRSVKSILKSGRRCPFPRYNQRISEITSDFIDEYISVTEPFVKYRASLIKKYGLDAIIVGSDQVWRPIYNWSIEDMYLRFAKEAKVKKLAYAASFGTSQREYSAEKIAELKPYARQFDAVSVREFSGVDLFRYYFDSDATKVLDPTMLLKSDYYDSIARKPDKYDYIFIYILDNNELRAHIIDMLSGLYQETGIVVVEDKDTNISPSQWLGYISAARGVVTDSFHGTVFSILFKKSFISIANKSRGYDRLASLLSPLDLMGRLRDSYTEHDIQELMKQKVDWTRVHELIDMQRETSIDFITSNLGTIE